MLALAEPAAQARPAPETLGSRLGAALASSSVRASERAAVVVDLATGATIFAANAARPLVPASNQKLLVSAVALVELGPAHRLRTDVLGDGAFADGVWRGDLVLRGGGDPTLDGRDLRLLARRVRVAGIERVDGRVLADATLFDRKRTAPGWKAGFLYNECEPLSALTVDRTWARDPALRTAKRFAAELERAGVEVAGGAALGRARTEALLLASVRSEPVSRLIRRMNRESDNFVAEMLLKAVGAHAVDRGTTRAGASVVRRDLARLGVPLDGVRILDGSGLSYGDRVTGRALAALLVAVWSDPELRDPFVASLAAPGEGTLEDRLLEPPARDLVRAKTGTTTVASTLSGYVGERYAFVILLNGRPVPTESARDAQDRFVRLLAAE